MAFSSRERTLPAQGAARDVGQAEGVFYHRIVRAADFERAFAGADVQAGFAVQLADQDQFPDQLQLCLSGMCAHSPRYSL